MNAEALKAASEPAVLDAAAWRLCESWLAQGATIRNAWGLAAVGRLGSPALALRLRSLLDGWQREGAEGLVLHALRALGEIGDNEAWQILDRVARQDRLPLVREEAGLLLGARAPFLRLAPEPFGVVPGLGLGPGGGRSPCGVDSELRAVITGASDAE